MTPGPAGPSGMDAPVAKPAHSSTSRLAENIPGLTGEVIEFIDRTAQTKQSAFALLATLAALGAAHGRRYASKTDLRTNVYTLGIGATGSGKNHARVVLKKLFSAAGLSHLIAGDRFASATSMLTALARQPSLVQFPDEHGETIKTVGNPRAPAHLQAMVGNFNELFTASNSTVYAAEYADAKSRQANIEQPNLCLYGTTTEDVLADALTSISIANGFVGRHLTLRIDNDYPPDNEEPAAIVPPASLVAKLRASYAVRPDGAGNLAGMGGSDGSTSTAIIAVRETLEASEFIRSLKLERVRRLKAHKTDRAAELWSRLAENSVKVAMIRAIGIDPVAPQITLPDIEWAAAVVRASCEYLSVIAREHVADNAAEAELLKVLRVIKAAGAGGVALNAITRRTGGLASRRRLDIINDLLAGQRIVSESVSTGGRPAVVFRWTGD